MRVRTVIGLLVLSGCVPEPTPLSRRGGGGLTQRAGCTLLFYLLGSGLPAHSPDPNSECLV